MQLRPTLVVSALKRYEPEVYEKITQRLAADQALTDLSKISDIVQDVCEVLNVQTGDLAKGRYRREITKIRELVVGVIFKFFQPHLLSGDDKGNVTKGLSKSISVQVNCPYNIIRFTVSNMLSAYDFYPAFRKEVDRIHELLKCKYNGKENCKIG